MQYKNIIIEKIKNNIAILTLNRPETLNAFNKSMLIEIDDFINNIIYDKKIRVLIITGSTKSFSSGADLKERKTFSTKQTLERLNFIGLIFNRINSLNIPTIAAIQGIAFGGGLELALSCDFRFMDKNSQIGLPECKLGIIPGAGGTQRLTRIIGVSNAKKLIFTGNVIKSKDALQYGIITSISNNIMEDAILLASSFLNSSYLSIEVAKIAIQDGYNLSLKEGLKLENKCYQKTLDSKDRLEGLKAFEEKRKPIFT